MAWQVPGYRHRLNLDGDAGRLVLAEEESSGELVVIKHLDDESVAIAAAAIEDLNALPPDYFVRIREFAEHDGHAAIVMDAINGVTLRALIRDHGAVGAEAALLLYRDVLAGLAYAHALDVTHGEIAPENVLVDADAHPVMTNAAAVRWRPRDVNLSTGVYLAPERWHEPPSPAADIYAATTMFVESLVGEPPFWEEADVATLRRRHEEEDVPLDGVPAALHDVVRVGMAKRAESRLEAAPLLELVETVAIAEYGRDWKDSGRALVVQRIELLSLPFGPVAGIDVTERVPESEDVANDDYYRDEEPSTVDLGTDADAAAVVVAASEIVELARLRDAAAAAAMDAASVEEELTEEEERAVAEIERLIGLDRPSPRPAPAAASTEATDIAPDAVDADAVDADVADGGSLAEAEPVEAVPVEAVPAEGAPAAAVPVEAIPVEEMPVEALESDAALVSVGVAAVPEGRDAAVMSHGGRGAFYRRHPWWTGAGVVFLAGAILGIVLWVDAGPTHVPTPTAHVSTPANIGPGASPSTGVGPGTGSSGGPSASVGPEPSASGPTAAPTSASPQPTLPVTGMLHPIRAMAAVAFGFLLFGALLMYVGRRRDDIPT